MFIQAKDFAVEERSNMRGGDGVVVLRHGAQKELPPHMRLCAVLEFPPGSSIGEHEHKGETELFYILEGTFIAMDNGKEVKLGVGDALFTGGGESHALRNAGDRPGKLLALIVVE
jgi:mannose-6-phosphate isomerase-like protein (cupin superfamily)